MKYRVKIKQKINRGLLDVSYEKYYVLQQKIFGFWFRMHDYKTLEEAQFDCDEFNKINGK